MTVALDHITTLYAEEVLSGERLTGKLVTLAAERHLRDIATGEQRGIWFDQEAADRALAFFPYLRHSKGEWAGQPFELEPWQSFIVGSLFGWKRRSDNTRRFRRAYLSVARKNGKTQLAAGIGLYLAFFDDEPGAEVYAAATKRDQAKICWSEAQRMVQRTPQLSRMVTALAHNLHRTDTHSKFEPVSSDYNSLDGLNCHGAIIDEYHAHPSGALADVLESSTGARRQPLMFYTTTAGVDNESACRDLDLDAQRVLEGLAEDDSLFAYIARIDPDDAWDNPEAWPKANPNLNVSIKLDSLVEQCERAKRITREQNEFRRKRCNQWTEQVERWLDLAAWDACDAPPEVEPGQPCFYGLDLSSKTDLTAGIAIFPPDDPDGYWDVLCDFWMPEENVDEKTKRDRAPYQAWIDAGYIETTEGNITDYDVIREHVKDDGLTYEIQEIPYDPWNATQLATQLGSDGATVVPLPQGYAHLSEPSKFLEGLILSGRLRHGGHPVLRWMAANVAIQKGPNESIRPVKDKSTGRIDGIVALVMAIARAMVHLDGDEADFFVLDLTPDE
jgi:phage terminase large subunit-like protein